jgi:hypothetical protein
VGRGQQLARRLAAQDVARARRGQEVGRVGLAAPELADAERPREALDAIGQIALERSDVEAMSRQHLDGVRGPGGHMVTKYVHECHPLRGLYSSAT